MLNSPVDCKGMIKSSFVEDMEKKGFYHIKTWGIHVPDSVIIDEIEHDYKLTLYSVFNNGVSLVTHAGCKSFFVNIPRKSHQNPSYNTKGLGGRRRRGRKNYD